MLTRNKKNYAGTMLVREGTVMSTPKLDLKGLSIKKVSTNKNTRNYFENVIKDTILSSGANISIKQVLNDFYEYEAELIEGLNAHKVDYLLPGKYGSFNNYKDPWRIMAVKATYLWNCLFPEDPIQEYEKVKMAKLLIPTYETIELDDNISDEIKSTIKKSIFENDNIKHLGAAVIALPLTTNIIPEWLIPYLNIDVMVADNLNAAMPIFEAMDLITTTYKQKKFMTNLVPIIV